VTVCDEFKTVIVDIEAKYGKEPSWHKCIKQLKEKKRYAEFRVGVTRALREDPYVHILFKDWIKLMKYFVEKNYK
jgi:heat shock protein HspQ